MPEELSLQSIYNKKRLFVFSEISDYEDYQMKTYTNTNFNIINQKGLFIFNGHPWKSIRRTKNLTTGFDGTPLMRQLQSIEIHKSMKEYIFKKIKLNKNYLFPNFIEFKRTVLKKTLEKFIV